MLPYPSGADASAGDDAPRVSVVLPTFNRAHLIGRAIQSVLEQTLVELELIIVDDGSTDDTGALLGALRDPRVRVLRLDTNRGVSRARNAGIAVARAAWVAFLDSDDEWDPLALELRLARAVAEPSAALVYCRYQRHDHVTGHRVAPALPFYEGDVLDHLLGVWSFATSVAMVRRQALLDVGGFSEDIDSREDYDLWLKLAAASYRFAGVDEPLVIKHHHGEGHLSGDPSIRLRDQPVLEARWGPLVRQRLGPAAFRRWRGDLEQRVHFAQFMRVREALAGGDRRAAWLGCLALARAPWRSGRFLVQAAMLTSSPSGPAPTGSSRAPGWRRIGCADAVTGARRPATGAMPSPSPRTRRPRWASTPRRRAAASTIPTRRDPGEASSSGFAPCPSRGAAGT